MAEVVLDRIAKEYPGGVWALRDLSLRLGDGELVVLVGPSGCGKTTTLRLVAGLEEPTTGEVRIGGRLVNGVPARARNVAMVFQRPALYPQLTVRDNLAFSERLREPGWLRRLLRGHGAPDALERRVQEAAELLGLEHLLERYPAQLSGGQQQRVAVGRALVRRPAAYLLDEPLSNLDPPRRVETRRELHLLQRRLRATMLYVTHDPWEALALGDRVVVLDQGMVQDAGTPRDLYERPANRFVAGFLGWPPMNLIDGRLCRVASGYRFEATTGGLAVAIDRSPSLDEGSDGRVTLGIRPQHVVLGEPGWRMRVALTETVGGAELINLERDGWHLTVRAGGGGQVREGDTVGVRFNMDRCHWFDGQTGRALPVAPSSA
jgi:multiple sugar transport system ATP-binding protein